MNEKRLFDTALKAFLFLSPIFFFKDFRLSFAQGLFFVFASFVLFAIALTIIPKRQFQSGWLGLILLWAFIDIFATYNPNPAAVWFNFWLACAGFIYIFAGMLLFYTIYCYADRPEIYIKPILAVCILNLILTIAQITGHDFMYKYAPSICGFMGISSQLGQYSALSLPIVFFINPWLTLIPIITLACAKSISAILAGFAGMIFLTWKRQIKVGIVITIGLILAIMGVLRHDYVLNKWKCRPIVWERVLRLSMEKPYLGHGYRSFNNADIGIGYTDFTRVHNDWLHTAEELGWPMVIFAGGFLINLWRKFRAKQNKDKFTYFLTASILIILVNCSGQTLLRYANIAGTFIVLLSFLMIKLNEV